MGRVMRIMVAVVVAVALHVGAARAQDIGGCTITLPISTSSSADLYTSKQRMRICSVVLVNGGTGQSVSLVEGTGSTCGTGTAALIGGTSASAVMPVSGILTAVSPTPWLIAAAPQDHLCILLSGSSNLSGTITLEDR